MRKGILFLVMMILLVSVHGAALAGDEGAAEATADEKMAAEMEAFKKFAQPGEHHRHLDATIGNWEATITAWPQPGSEPVKMTGAMESHWILGGRFVESTYSGSFMGDEFEGKGVDGYDKQQQKYVGTWRDSMGTMTMIFEGSCEEGGKVRTMTGEYLDPTSGQKVRNRAVTTIIDENTYNYESYTLLPDGSEFKNMELVATRKP